SEAEYLCRGAAWTQGDGIPWGLGLDDLRRQRADPDRDLGRRAGEERRRRGVRADGNIERDRMHALRQTGDDNVEGMRTRRAQYQLDRLGVGAGGDPGDGGADVPEIGGQRLLTQVVGDGRRIGDPDRTPGDASERRFLAVDQQYTRAPRS